MSAAITLEEVAMLVECPVCGAGSIAGDTVEGCWDDEGRGTEPTHAERFDYAQGELERARQVIVTSRLEA